MSCKSIQAKLSAYLDGEMSGVEMQTVRAHVHGCRDCQIELDGLKSIQAILREMPITPEPSLALPSMIQQRVSEKRGGPVRVGLLLALPAILLAVFFTLSRSGPKPAPDRDVAINRQLANDQIFDARNDSTSGASLVHYTNYEGH